MVGELTLTNQSFLYGACVPPIFQYGALQLILTGCVLFLCPLIVPT